MSARAALVEVVVYLAIVLAVDHACRLYQRRRNAAREIEARRAADKARHPASQAWLTPERRRDFELWEEQVSA